VKEKLKELAETKRSKRKLKGRNRKQEKVVFQEKTILKKKNKK